MVPPELMSPCAIDTDDAHVGSLLRGLECGKVGVVASASFAAVNANEHIVDAVLGTNLRDTVADQSDCG